MDRWDDVAIITFIACDVVLENLNWFKNFYRHFCRSLKKIADDIIFRL